MISRARLGDRLLAAGKINSDQLKVALMEQRKTGKDLGVVLFQLGFITERQAQEAIGETVGYESVNLNGIVPDANAMALISESFARTYLMMPISLSGQSLKVVMAAPDDILLVDKLKRHIQSAEIQICPSIGSEQEILSCIDSCYGYELSIDGILSELETGDIDISRLSATREYSQPMVRLVDSILTDAVKKNASDVHFEPEESYIRLRYRIDGVLQQVRLLHKYFWSGLVVRLKVISKLDLTEHRLPQDGRMELLVDGRRIDFRVSSLPNTHGENFVLRILDREKGIVPLTQLGLDSHALQELKLMLARPNGIMLVTGPTGSGKTTTLYSILNELNQVGVNIMTLEDPVEYPMAMIRQTEVNEEIGMSFAAGIRALLRQDPDIILVGEIRDAETAEMAVRAAMTGHQVFSTLHTNSAIGAIPRLIDIGVSPAVLSGNIVGVVAQRLLRKLCKLCKEPYQAGEREKLLMGIKMESPFTLYRSKGCDCCHQTGYKGRVAVLEILRFTPEMDELLLAGAPQSHILNEAVSNGFLTMSECALRWVRQGETSIEEVGRAVNLSDLR